jgi:hypothetical protein
MLQLGTCVKKGSGAAACANARSLDALKFISAHGADNQAVSLRTVLPEYCRPPSKTMAGAHQRL